MIQLTDTALQAIKDSTKLKGEIQSALEISSNTLYKYIKTNDPKLTNANAVKAISVIAGLTEIDILIEVA